jgi:hypothetical protein
VISAFYFNTEPIYHRLPLRHDVSHARHGRKTFGDLSPHKLFPLVVVGIYLVHFAISWVWAAAVRRLGLSAVTWGVSLDEVGPPIATLILDLSTELGRISRLIFRWIIEVRHGLCGLITQKLTMFDPTILSWGGLV